jgi:hypothetical protein
MSNEATPDQSQDPIPLATDVHDAAESGAETVADAPTTRSRGWRRRPKRYQMALAGLVMVIGAAGWYFLTPAAPPPEAPAEALTDAQRFELLFAELSKSEETVARMDAITIDDAMLRRLVTLDRLTTLQVKIESISNETVALISRMPKLEQLHLRRAPINDEMLAQIATSPTIWLLNLPAAVITPAAIESLESMPMLRNLRLGIKEGTNRHARAVAKLRRLRTVHLIGIAVSDDGLQSLAALPQLESLYLDGSAVTEGGWTWLFQNHPQLHVHIDQKHHDLDPQKH